MKTILHKADTRGHVNLGWLTSYHSFSFGNYYNPKRMNFGALRVLNDDIVAGGQGFGTHPHKNMEIISIPLEGDLEHQDSMHNTVVINQGDIQAMSAGTGIFHSEYNKNKNKEVKFLQIWIHPKQQNVTPKFDQISIKEAQIKNKLYQIVSPNKNDEGVWIHQDAWFYLGEFDVHNPITYNLKKEGNGIYVFVLEGTIEVEGQLLNKRDGFGIWEVHKIQGICKTSCHLLVIEVPMNF